MVRGKVRLWDLLIKYILFGWDKWWRRADKVLFFNL